MAEADSVVSEECIEELLEFFTKGSYKAKSVDRRVSEGKAFRGCGSPLVDEPGRVLSLSSETEPALQFFSSGRTQLEQRSRALATGTFPSREVYR